MDTRDMKIRATGASTRIYPWQSILMEKAIDYVRWEDLRFPATTIRQGATTKPDYDVTNMGLLFPQNDADEIAYIIAQMPHSMKLGTNLYPHVHWVQDEAELPVWKLAYRWYENSGDPTGEFTVLTATAHKFTYSSGSILQITDFPEIDGSGINSVSSFVDIKLYRDDNVVSGDVLLKEFDFHYQVDSFGSYTEYAKDEA